MAWHAAAAEPAKIDQLVVRSWPGPWDDAMVEVGTKFTAKTGIPVAYDHRLDNVVATLIQTAQAQHRPPPVDVFYTFDVTGQKAAMRGLLDTFTVADVPNLADMLPMAKPAGAGDGWETVNVGADIVTLLYRADRFPNGPPQSYTALLDPALKGRILLYSEPQFTLTIVAAINNWSIPADMDKIWSFIQDKIKPQDPILGGDPETLGGFQRDEIDLTVSYPTIARQLASQGIRVARAKEGLVGGYEAVGVPKGLADGHRYWATQFINFLLSKEVLEPYCQRLMVACLRKDMTPTEAELKDPGFPQSAEDLQSMRTIPPAIFAAHESEWSARYDEILK